MQALLASSSLIAVASAGVRAPSKVKYIAIVILLFTSSSSALSLLFIIKFLNILVILLSLLSSLSLYLRIYYLY